jgi:hypothetical protein
MSDDLTNATNAAFFLPDVFSVNPTLYHVSTLKTCTKVCTKCLILILHLYTKQ